MFSDIFHYGSFNIKLAQLVGLKEAVYVQCITQLCCDGNVTSIDVDRQYITCRTTLDVEEQLTIDKELIKLDLIRKKDDDNITIDFDKLTSFVSQSSLNTLPDVVSNIKSMNKSTRATKEEIQRRNAMKNISTTNPELRDAYSLWIEAVLTRYGKITNGSVIQAEKAVDSFANHNLDVAISVLEFASIKGYDNMELNIQLYKDSCSNSVKTDILNDNIHVQEVFV